MESIFISTNGNYFVTDESIYSIYEDKQYNLNEVSIEKWLDIFNENTQHSLKNGIHKISTLASYHRKITYQLMEGLSTAIKFDLMLEYEGKFGNLLLTENHLLIENWFSDAWNWTKDKVGGAATWITDKVKKFGSFAVKTGQDLIGCITGKGCSPFFEDYREMLFNPVSIGVEAFLSATGVGTAIPIALWGVMLAWDLYLMATDYSKFSWLNLIIDILGVGLGAIAKSFKGLLGGEKVIQGTMGKNLKYVVDYGEKIPGAKQVFTKVGEILKSSLSTISSGLKAAGTFLSEKLGLKWVGKVIDSFSAKAAQLLDGLGIKAGEEKLGQELVNPKTGRKFRSAAKVQAANQAILQKGVKGGLKHGAIAQGVMTGAESETGQKMMRGAGETTAKILGINKGGGNLSTALASGQGGFVNGIDY